jgi:hypothetical protein
MFDQVFAAGRHIRVEFKRLKVQVCGYFVL